jgi:integral membrane protein (TIGR00529 family)
VALLQAPLTVAAIAAGVVLGLRGIDCRSGSAGAVNRSGQRESLRQLALSIWPILVVIVLSLGFQLELALSLVVALLLTTIAHRISPGRLGSVLVQSLSPRRAVLVLAIMVFNQMVSASGAAESASATFAAWGISPLLTSAAVPFVVGLVTGLSLPMVGISFPLLLPLISGSSQYEGLVSVAYAAGFIGVLLSPVHLCLALTREYFKPAWAPLYRRLLPSAAVLALGTAIAWFVA